MPAPNRWSRRRRKRTSAPSPSWGFPGWNMAVAVTRSQPGRGNAAGRTALQLLRSRPNWPELDGVGGRSRTLVTRELLSHGKPNISPEQTGRSALSAGLRRLRDLPPRSSRQGGGFGVNEIHLRARRIRDALGGCRKSTPRFSRGIMESRGPVLSQRIPVRARNRKTWPLPGQQLVSTSQPLLRM